MNDFHDNATPSLTDGRRRLAKIAGVTLILVILLAALIAIHQILVNVRIVDVRQAVLSIAHWNIGTAILFAAGSYVMLTGYDVVALRHLGKPLPYRLAALAAFTSYSISHTVGLSVLTAGSIRFRVYSPLGLTASEIVKLTAICALTFGLSVTLILSLALLSEPVALSRIDKLPPEINRYLGAVLVAALIAYTSWTVGSGRGIEFRGWRIETPDLGTTLRQFALGVTDLALAAAALYMLLPTDMQLGYLPFAGVFVAAMSLGFLSHVPGGIGVFEAAMLLALPELPPDKLLASLLVFRLVYYLLPFALAALLLAGLETMRRPELAGDLSDRVERMVSPLAPALMGSLVMIAGALLLFSGATPALETRLQHLRSWLPLPFVELSHLTASIIGMLLVILARGLYRRMDAAYHLTMALLGAGAAAALLKGLDYEETLVIGATMLLLFLSRKAFYRKSSLFDEPFSVGWIAAIAIVVGLSLAIGVFAHKYVEYSNELWWQFAYHGDAPRFLRATLAALIVVLGFFALRLLRPKLPEDPRDGLIPDAVRGLVAASDRADAHLALTGDKHFLLSERNDAFLMYGVHGRSWVVLGDPVGEVDAWRDLLWRFREMVDRHDGWPVFYQVRAEHLALYLDMGSALTKLGETGQVDLRSFSLDGSARKELRHAVRRAEKQGLKFEIVPASRIRRQLPQLKRISDDWLADMDAHEKGFSLGSFTEDYIGMCDCAVVHRDGKPVAFANLLKSANNVEFTVDLMRHTRDAPNGTMDFLFTRLILWGKEQGFERFSLGMAPLAGLASHALAPTWSRIGTVIFRHGERFYNFEGLRAYKEKFDPDWTPRYLASPGGLALPRILLDVTSLINGDSWSFIRGT